MKLNTKNNTERAASAAPSNFAPLSGTETNGATQPPAKVRCKSALDIPLWVARMITGKKILPPEACFFLIISPIEDVAEKMFDHHPDLEPLLDRMKEVKESYGLAYDEYWDMGDEPPEMRPLNDEHDRLYRQVFHDAFVAFGEPEKGQLYVEDNAEYCRRREAGRAFFLEPMDLNRDGLDLLASL